MSSAGLDCRDLEGVLHSAANGQNGNLFACASIPAVRGWCRIIGGIYNSYNHRRSRRQLVAGRFDYCVTGPIALRRRLNVEAPTHHYSNYAFPVLRLCQLSLELFLKPNLSGVVRVMDLQPCYHWLGYPGQPGIISGDDAVGIVSCCLLGAGFFLLPK